MGIINEMLENDNDDPPMSPTFRELLQEEVKIVLPDEDAENTAAEEYFGTYLQRLIKAASPLRLPHLETLVWADGVRIPDSLFTAFSTCAIRRLQLTDIRMFPNMPTIPPWPLEALRISFAKHEEHVIGSDEWL